MKSILYTFLTFTIFLFFACQNDMQDSEKDTYSPHENPHAEGFDLEGSDAEAIVIADEVMKAMGGYKNWSETRYLSWNFFNIRTLLWDKKTGDVRIDFPKDSLTAIINIHKDEGKMMKNGVLVELETALYKQLLEQTKGIWINDSYWLVMPYKLKDSGVTLKVVGEDSTSLGGYADVLSLTFKEVGFTPNNKYLVYVDKETRLITQWDFYGNATDSAAVFSNPWGNYQQYGNIMLSDDRGQRGLSDVKVLESVPDNAFTSFDEIQLD